MAKTLWAKIKESFVGAETTWRPTPRPVQAEISEKDITTSGEAIDYFLRTGEVILDNPLVNAECVRVHNATHKRQVTSWEELIKINVPKEDWDDESEPETPKFIELRPMRFDEFIGHAMIKERLIKTIFACQEKQVALPHMAFIGEPGLGKTSLAGCVAQEMWPLTSIATVGSAVTCMEDFDEMIYHVSNAGIIFVDEAHDLSKSGVISGMLPLLEDWQLHTKSGSKKVDPFTLILATTDYGMLDRAIRSRLGFPYMLQPYNVLELTQVIENLAAGQNYNLAIPSMEIAKRSRGNPRRAKILTKEVVNLGVEAFDILGIDERGMDHVDKEILRILKNGPAALSRCALVAGLDTRTYVELHENFLFRAGYINISSRGRMITQDGLAAIGE